MTWSRRLSMRARPGLLGLLAGVLPFSRESTAAQPQKPNIVLIVTDDMQASDLDVMPKTRNLLGNAGTTFPHLFAATPLCSPSRASLLTGQLAHNHGLLGNQGETGGWRRFADLGLGTRTIQVPLHDAGYRTGLIGKLLNGVPGSGEVAPGWDHAFVQTDFQYRGFEINDNGQRRRFGKKKYSTSVLREQAVTFIRETPDGQPLFLHLSPIAPHNIPRSPRKLEKRFRRAKQAGTPDLNEADVSDKPEFLRRRSRLKRKKLRVLNEHQRARLRTLIPVDDMVASVVETLEQEGRLDNTYVFFLSDNGMLIGHHRHTGKTVPYDRGARTPLLARGPGFAAGANDERMALNVDVAATIAAVTGIDLPDLDGLSLLETPARDDVLLEWLGEPESQNSAFYSPSGPRYAAAAHTRYPLCRARDRRAGAVRLRRRRARADQPPRRLGGPRAGSRCRSPRDATVDTAGSVTGLHRHGVLVSHAAPFRRSWGRSGGDRHCLDLAALTLPRPFRGRVRPTFLAGAFS